jgi:hypothetical protein
LDDLDFREFFFPVLFRQRHIRGAGEERPGLFFNGHRVGIPRPPTRRQIELNSSHHREKMQGMRNIFRGIFLRRRPAPPPPEPTPTREGYLTPQEAAILEDGTCPECQQPSLREGPCGGMSVNVLCCNYECLSKFNVMGPFGVERLTPKSSAGA